MLYPLKEYCRRCWKSKLFDDINDFRHMNSRVCIDCEDHPQTEDEVAREAYRNGVKFCRACREYHRLSDFAVSGGSKDGYEYECIKFKNTR